MSLFKQLLVEKVKEKISASLMSKTNR